MSYSFIYDRYQVLSKVSRFQSFKVPKFQSFKVSKFQSFKVPQFKVANFQSLKVSISQSFKASKFQNPKFHFSNFIISNSQKSKFPKLSDHTLPNITTSKISKFPKSYFCEIIWDLSCIL